VTSNAQSAPLLNCVYTTGDSSCQLQEVYQDATWAEMQLYTTQEPALHPACVHIMCQTRSDTHAC
jgi:hypothetical protein